MRWTKGMMSWLGNHVVDYPTPANITYVWGLGSLSGFSLVVQIITGVLLSMNYIGNEYMAFTSVYGYIMREVQYGWLTRYVHMNGASIFFVVVYMHMLRGLYYGSFMKPKERVWLSGVVIYVLMMATAFIGYVLPWGQMSLWGATVITNMITIIPVFGVPLVEWIWGGWVINNATLSRFYTFHFLLPFVISGVVLLHITYLHEKGSTTPIGIDGRVDSNRFYPYYYVKDIIGVFISLTILLIGTIYNPEYLCHLDNYERCDPMETPPHIVPEWYFLPFYAILRAIPHKVLGVLAMGGAIAGIALWPGYSRHVSGIRAGGWRRGNKGPFWMFIASAVVLGWVGGKPMYYPYENLGIIPMIYYYSYVYIGVPLLTMQDTGIYRRYTDKSEIKVEIKEEVVELKEVEERKVLINMQNKEERHKRGVGIRIRL